MRGVKAVIFDMDGVLIDSEPLWRRAMIHEFRQSGIEFSEEDCRKTTGMRLMEVVKYWSEFHPLEVHKLHDSIINHLIELIRNEGKEMSGVSRVLDYLSGKNLKLGLASSSNYILIEESLQKLGMRERFQAISSAQFLSEGKPHPGVYIDCAAKLKIEPQYCLAIEDSLNGIRSAKAAGMKTAAMPETNNAENHDFSISDHVIHSLEDVIKLF